MNPAATHRNPIAPRDAAFAARRTPADSMVAVGGLLEQPNTAH